MDQMLIALLALTAFASAAIGYVAGCCERSRLDDPSEHGSRPL